MDSFTREITHKENDYLLPTRNYAKLENSTLLIYLGSNPLDAIIWGRGGHNTLHLSIIYVRLLKTSLHHPAPFEDFIETCQSPRVC